VKNVVFEHGYLIGKLGRSRVSAIFKETIVIPNNISDVAYVALDERASWKVELKKEMRSV
jgi:predicted nucleotide-binding protein